MHYINNTIAITTTHHHPLHGNIPHPPQSTFFSRASRSLRVGCVFV